MVRPFKFFRNPLLISHDGHEINVGEYFYSVNKEDIVSFKGNIVKKYTIVTRCIHPIYKDKFKPDHDLLWYFKSKSNAEWLIDIWKRQDDMINYYNNADIIITFRRQNEF
jgi:hypothetical protein